MNHVNRNINITKTKLCLTSIFISSPKLQYMNNFEDTRTTHIPISTSTILESLSIVSLLNVCLKLQNLYFAYSNYANNRFKGEYMRLCKSKRQS